MERIGGEVVHPPTTIRKVALASFVGSVMEWYDFFIYGTATALVLGKLFFPNASSLVGTLEAFATFGVGFLFRPLGGAFFGHFGDKVGRKAMLVITLGVMGIATVLIGCLPTYSSIGIWAPVLLVLLRCLQGFSVGGEWAGGALMVIEHAPVERRGFYGSWPQVGPSAGTLLSTGVFAIFSGLPQDQFLSWGWRVPFLLSAVVVAIGLVIRLKIAESPVFEEIKEEHREPRTPLLELFRSGEGRNVLLIMGMRLAINTTYYGATVFALSYATDQLGISNTTMLACILVTAALGFVSKPIYGAISDRIGRRPIYLAGAVVGALIIFPFFWALQTRSVILIFLAFFFIINISHDLNDAVESSFFSELFGSKDRYSGVAIGHQLGGAITGFTPLIAGALTAAGGWPLAATYFVFACLISCICIYVTRENFRRDLTEAAEHESRGITARPRVQ
ncbi:MFS transporter [Rubrobacter calidifluminis]|uniref:MFS transporter n=1 Tax=Rubrobacter calidifluminis TaxID=1392640 RepID=UPI002360A18D|nr:MFS transporter [Rubrobacter calidifluminis]